MNSSLRQLF